MRRSDKEHMEILLLAVIQQIHQLLLQLGIEVEFALFIGQLRIQTGRFSLVDLRGRSEALEVVVAAHIQRQVACHHVEALGILRPQTVVFDQGEEVLPSLVDGHVLLDVFELVEAERQVVKELVDVRLVGFVVGVAVEEGVRLNDDQTGVLCPHDLLDGGFDALGGDGFRGEQVAGEAVLLIGSARHKAGVDIAGADEHHVE